MSTGINRRGKTMQGKWIWTKDECSSENERICFMTKFAAPEEEMKSCILNIAAVTKYAVYVNGSHVGNGPIRSAKGESFFDTYGIEKYLHSGENILGIEVWNYGWSTYQTVFEDGRLRFEVLSDHQVIAESDEKVKCCRDFGSLPYVPKRNVNLGFTDYYDARKFDSEWAGSWQENWEESGVCEVQERVLKPRPIRSFRERSVYPEQIISLEDVSKNCQVITINTRTTFFTDRKDADETTMNGYIGCEFHSDSEKTGIISFPNRTWNGMIGTFRIGNTIYEVTDAHREIEVTLPKGRSLFLMQLHGKFDDLYCHMELRFKEKTEICGMGTDHSFFVVGPTASVKSALDGIHDVYDEIEFYTEEDERYFSCETLQELERAGAEIKWVPARYVMEDAYMLSLNRLAKREKSYAVMPKHMGILWNNSETTVIDLPKCGDYRRMIVDFGDLYVGNLEFTLYAGEGTIVDIYGFENMYHREPDFTIGLNNGMRYICKQGWQHYRGMARIGMRYAIISVRNNSEPVLIRNFHINYSTFSVSNTGSFCCDDERLNKIWSMCRHTHELCMEDSFTDCPTYEQAFWLGDAQTSAVVNNYVFGEYEFVRHNLILGTTARNNSPLFNALTPTDWGTSIPLWTMNWMISLGEYIEVTGDYSILHEIYDKVRECLYYYANLVSEEGLFVVNAWNLIDWADIDTPPGYAIISYQGMLAHCFGKGSYFAAYMDRHEDQEFFADMESKMKKLLDEKMWDSERQMFGDAWHPEKGFSSTYSIQTHSLLMLFDAIIDPEKKETVREYMTSLPDEFVRAGSPFMLYYYYEAAASEGNLKEVFDDISFRWGEMIRYETTTCWEVFPGFYENSRTRSYCHSWSSSPAALMQKYLLGIKMEKEGFRKVSFEIPNIPNRWCRGGIPTPSGLIYVDWNRDEKVCNLEIPADIEAEIHVPEEYQLNLERTEKE